MKKNLFLILGLALAAVFTGCSKDDPETSGHLAVSTSELAATITGGPLTFNVTTGGAWSASSDAGWAVVSPTSGNGSGLITVTVASNAGAAADRTAKITVTAAGMTKEVTVSQEAQLVSLGDGTRQGFRVTSDMTLSAEKIYLLKGFVYVADGVTLTIEPGTIIKGEKATQGTLIVERGGRIMAQGSAEKPIVFTSQQPKGQRKPGDWGGVILMGKARNNLGEMTIEGGVDSRHGGQDDADNSGVLSYVRIEFAGIEYGPDNEINGLTMGSVGSKTKIDHIQVSHSGDDSFEWFGGAVNAKYLIAYKGWDDDFDADNGFNGKVQFGLAVRDPEVADKSASNGFETDNNSDGSTAEPYTSAIFSNISSFGPVTDPATYIDQGRVHGSDPAGVFQAGIQLRRNTRLNVFNSVIAGWPIGLIIENDKGTAQTWASENRIRINQVVLAGMQRNFQDKAKNASKPVVDPAIPDTFVSGYFNGRPGNGTFPTIADLKVSAAPVAIPAADSPLLNAAAWTDDYVSGDFFDKTVTYIGAFGPTETATNNWTSGWANFDPQHTDY